MQMAAVWKDNILCALFLLLFLHCLWWLRGIHRRPCGITLYYLGTPWFQKWCGEACKKAKILITPYNITLLTVGCPPRWCIPQTQAIVSLGRLVQCQFGWGWMFRYMNILVQGYGLRLLSICFFAPHFLIAVVDIKPSVHQMSENLWLGVTK